MQTEEPKSEAITLNNRERSILLATAEVVGAAANKKMNFLFWVIVSMQIANSASGFFQNREVKAMRSDINALALRVAQLESKQIQNEAWWDAQLSLDEQAAKGALIQKQFNNAVSELLVK